MTVSTAMFMLDIGHNLGLLCIGKLPAVLRLNGATLVVKLKCVNIGVDRDCSVVAGHAALIGHS